MQQCLPTFSAALVQEAFFPFISPIGIFKKSLFKSYKPWTEPTSHKSQQYKMTKPAQECELKGFSQGKNYNPMRHREWQSIDKWKTIHLKMLIVYLENMFYIYCKICTYLSSLRA